MDVRPVEIADYWDDALPLMEANWAETGFDFEFSPSFMYYEKLQKAGALLAVAALDKGELVGYCTAFIGRHPFNPGLVVCSSDSLFVVPAYRRSLCGGRIIKVMERAAKDAGASIVMWHLRDGTVMADSMLKHGYKPADRVVMKGL